LLFIGVNKGRFNFDKRGKRFNHQLPGGSPENNFVLSGAPAPESKKDIYKELRKKSFSTHRKILEIYGKLRVSDRYSSTLSKGRYYSTSSNGLNRMTGLDP